MSGQIEIEQSVLNAWPPSDIMDDPRARPACGRGDDNGDVRLVFICSAGDDVARFVFIILAGHGQGTAVAREEHLKIWHFAVIYIGIRLRIWFVFCVGGEATEHIQIDQFLQIHAQAAEAADDHICRAPGVRRHIAVRKFDFFIRGVVADDVPWSFKCGERQS